MTVFSCSNLQKFKFQNINTTKCLNINLMSSTPEINTSVKFSPYGKPISKTLLTPCRPMGLSRKRKTPGSLSKIPLTSGNDSVSPLLTPINLNLSTTLNESTPVIQVNKRLKKDIKENRAAKKCLDQKFRNTLQEKTASVSKTQNVHSPVPEKSTKSRNSSDNVKVWLHKISDQEIKNYSNHSDFVDNFGRDDKADISSDEESEVINVKKKRAVILSDDEDFGGFSNNKNEVIKEADDLKIKSEEIIECREKLSVSSNDIRTKSEFINKVKDINLEEEINVYESDICSVDEILSGSSTRSEKTKNTAQNELTTVKPIMISDDEDFMDIKDNKNKLKLFRTESLEKKKKSVKENVKNKALKATKSSENHSKTFKSTKTASFSILDDEDAFTSTPEKEKSEKTALIEKIKMIENDVKLKRKKLEDLKQAQIYKSKHNIEELKKLTDIWRDGCVTSLNNLLSQLQMQGPMTMPALLNSLKISGDMVKSLMLNLEEKKKDENKLSDCSQDFEN